MDSAEKEVVTFEEDLRELMQDASTVAKINLQNNEPCKLPISCATNLLYLLAVYTPSTLKEIENVNALYSYCLKLIEEKIKNIHLEGIGQAIWGLKVLLEKEGPVSSAIRGANAQRIVDNLIAALEGKPFGDEIRYVEHVGCRLDRFAAKAEHMGLGNS